MVNALVPRRDSLRLAHSSSVNRNNTIGFRLTVSISLVSQLSDVAFASRAVMTTAPLIVPSPVRPHGRSKLNQCDPAAP